MTSPLAAVSFLTRIPVAPGRVREMEEVARAQAWFPAVGLLLGGALLAVDRVASKALPPASVDVLIVVTLALLTGAIHLDGLADSADGLFGGATRGRRLELMRDVHAGTYAVTAVVCVLALKWAGLVALPLDVRTEALLCVPCLARFAMLVVIAVFPYARSEGVGLGFRRHAWPWGVCIGGGTALFTAAVLLGPGGLLVLAGAIAAALALGALSSRLIGGVTGDVYGATAEVCEALLLLVIAALANRGWIDGWLFS